MLQQGQVLIDAQAGKVRCGCSSEISKYPTFIKEVGEMGNPEVFDGKKRFYYYMGLLLSHSVKYSHLNSIILACKILKIQYNLA